MIEQTYFLDMIPGESTPPVVHVSQFDVNSRTLTFNLMKGGVAFVPDAGMSVTLDGMKPDNHVFSYPMTVNGSSVSIDVLTQMTVVSGHVRCEVSVSNQNGKIGSANFILAVEESPIDSGSISESDIPIFEDLKNQAQQAAADAEQSASDAESAASSVSAILPASAGTAGQVLTKTPTGADWKTPTGGQWGGITGNLSDQTDLNNALSAINSNLNQKVSRVNGETPDTNGNVEIDATDIETSIGVAIKSVNGNPVTIADALQGKALGVNTTLEPIQDLHGYDKPWAGGAGKNLCAMTLDNIKAINDGTWSGNSFSKNGITITVQTDDDGNVIGFIANGTAVSRFLFSLQSSGYQTCEQLGLKLNTAYKFNGAPEVNNTSIRYDSGGAWSYPIVTGTVDISFTFTSETNTYKPRIIVEQGATVDNALFKPMVRLASETDATFEPYSNICPITGRTQVEITNKDSEDAVLDSVTVNLGQTVYGGTLDVNTGTLTVTHAIKALKDLIIAGGSGSYFYSSISDKAYGIVNMISSCYQTVNTSAAGMPQGSIKGNGGSNTIYIMDTRYSTAADLISAMGDETICYELATPQTIQLTPAQIQLLTGTNIITTNADDLSVRYYASGQTGNVEGNIAFLLDKTANNETAINTVSESIAPTETGTATQNYAVGSYLMLNNRLCKVTAAIATGEQIIVGSNVRYTTVAEELAAILAQINA